MYSVRNWIGVGAAALLAGALTFATTAGFAMPRYDGLWSVSIVTTKGDCIASYRYPMRIANGILVNGGDIAVDVAGRVGGDGLVTVILSLGDTRARASARRQNRRRHVADDDLRGLVDGGTAVVRLLCPKNTLPAYDNPGPAGCLRTAPRPGYAPTLLTSVFRATIASD